MSTNYCNECGTENESEYKYCKNCGAKLFDENSATEEKNYTYQSSPNGTYNQTKDFIVDSIDGIPAEEISLFIGKKSYEIMPKFSKMVVCNSKVSWCWPVAILGFLFGPLGSALWFFYRKMYKPAIILSVIGAVLAVINALLTFGTTSATLDLFVNAFSSGDFEQALSVMESMDISSTVPDMIAGFLSDISSFLSFLLCGLFGFHFYKKHCIEKIHTFKTQQADQRYYRLGLTSIGGVSGGMLAIGILILISVENITSVITAITAMISQ